MVARVGFEPATLRTKSTERTAEPPRPTIVLSSGELRSTVTTSEDTEDQTLSYKMVNPTNWLLCHAILILTNTVLNNLTDINGN